MKMREAMKISPIGVAAIGLKDGRVVIARDGLDYAFVSRHEDDLMNQIPIDMYADLDGWSPSDESGNEPEIPGNA